MKISPTRRVETLNIYEDFKRSDPPVYDEILPHYPQWHKELIRITNEGIDRDRRELAYKTVSFLHNLRNK